MNIEDYLIANNFEYPLYTLEDNAVRCIASNYNIVAEKCRINRKRALSRLRKVLLAHLSGCKDVQAPIYREALDCIEKEIGK